MLNDKWSTITASQKCNIFQSFDWGSPKMEEKAAIETAMIKCL